MNGTDKDGRIWETSGKRTYAAHNFFNTLINGFGGAGEHETPGGGKALAINCLIPQIGWEFTRNYPMVGA